MRRWLSGTFLAVLALLCLPALSQDNVLRIGVPMLHNASKDASVDSARDHLIKSLNQHKPDKKVPFVVQAIPLASEWGTRALTEAREKKCEFVLSIRVGNLRTNTQLSNNGAAGMYEVPVFHAAAEYRIIRVIDGAGIAIGSLEEADSNFLGAAVDRAISNIAEPALEELAKGGNVPHGKPVKDATAPLASETGEIGVRPCVWLPDNIPHSDKLLAICEYALSLTERMPNFICNQEASRFHGKNAVPFDQITALVRYEDGKESFEEIQLNGKPAPDATTQTPGLWSTGQFGSNLRSIFDPWNQPLFTFDKEGTLEDRQAWIFRYRIAKQNDPLWRLHGENGVLAPPYQGELWVDQATGNLLRFTSVATDIPHSFSMASAELRIDYSKVPFADGSSFVLPEDFTLTTAVRGEEATRNVVQFRSCHKFRAKAQMVLNVPKSAAESASEAIESAAAAAERERMEDENLYAILREQAIRDDNSAIDAEHRLAMNVATVSALSRLAHIEKILEKRAELGSASTPPSANPDIETTLKVTVKLVPVSVVLRDSKGNAIGNFRKEDFLLFDNGVTQTIKSFSLETSKAIKTPAPALQRAEAGAAQTLANDKPAADRYVAYLFDDIHTSFEDLASARQAATHRVNALRAEDRVAILTTSGQVFQDFTSDPGKLHEALQALRPHPVRLGDVCPPISPYMADLIVNQGDREALGLATRDAVNCAFAGMGSGSELGRAEQIAKSAAFEVLNASNSEDVMVLSGLRNLVRQMGNLRGFRSIVLVSPGFLTPEVAMRQGEADLIETALRSEIVVNTLDVRGVYTPVVSPNSSHPANPTTRFRYDSEEAITQTEVMASLAYSTGGTFFHSNNDLDEGFRRTTEAPEYLYVLGFSPQKLDGKYHKLKVRLNSQTKLTVQAREGYYALKPSDTVSKPGNSR